MSRCVLLLLLVSLFLACGDEVPPLIEDDARREYAEAYCLTVDECGDDYGALWVSVDDCVESRYGLLQAPVFEGFNPAMTDADLTACADTIRAATCEEFYGQDEFRSTPPCDALRAQPGATAASPANQPIIGCDCVEGESCRENLDRGPICRQCVPDVDEGADCSDARCQSDLVCNSEDSICTRVLGFGCDSDYDCGGGTDYYCDDDFQCQPRAPGTPCHSNTLFDPVAQVDLACVGGQAVTAPGLNEACDDEPDCGPAGLVCVEERCVEKRSVGESCEEPETDLGAPFRVRPNAVGI